MLSTSSTRKVGRPRGNETCILILAVARCSEGKASTSRCTARGALHRVSLPNRGVQNVRCAASIISMVTHALSHLLLQRHFRYGYQTQTNVKYVLVLSDTSANDQNINGVSDCCNVEWCASLDCGTWQFFKRFHDLWVRAVSNPFYELGGPMQVRTANKCETPTVLHTIARLIPSCHAVQAF